MTPKLSKREYLAGVLALVQGSPHPLDSEADSPNDSTGSIGEIFAEPDERRLREKHPRPGDFDIGLTDRDGILLGANGEWTGIRDSDVQALTESDVVSSAFHAPDTAQSDNLVVPVASGLSTSDAIDPTKSKRPVQQAMNMVHEQGGGRVMLPPTKIREEGPIYAKSGCGIIGLGAETSKIRITNTETDGVVFDAERNGGDHVRQFEMDGFALNGPAGKKRTGVAIHHVNGDTERLTVGHLVLWGWNNSVYRVERNVGPFETFHQMLTVYGSDAGNHGALFEFDSYYGPAQYFATIAAYPKASTSGRNSTVIRTRGGTQVFENLNLGGSSGQILRQERDGKPIINTCNWEPTKLVATPPALMRLEGEMPVSVGQVRQVDTETSFNTPEYVYEVAYDVWNGYRPGRKMMGPYLGQEPPNENIVKLTSPNQPLKPSFYWGPAKDIDVVHSGTNTGGLRALGSAGTGVG